MGMRRRRVTGCPTGKIRYRDELGAMIALARCQVEPGNRRQEKRHYMCPACAGFHLTSRADYVESQRHGID